MRAVILGGISWNTMLYIDRFPSPVPQTMFASAMHETVGSSGAGKALNLRRLGMDVTMWGLLGDDEPGRLARQAMERRGVRLLTQVDPAGTMRHVNLMDASGDRISIFAVPGSQDFPVDTSLVSDLVADADIVTVTIFDHCRRFLPMLREMGKPVWIDIHDYDGLNPYHQEFIEAADYLVMSSTAMQDWWSFLEGRVAAGTRVAVCTHGARGASGFSMEEGWIDVPAVETEVVDTNGAGDAFFAGFSAAWVSGAGLEASLVRGSHTAAAALQTRELAPE